MHILLWILAVCTRNDSECRDFRGPLPEASDLPDLGALMRCRDSAFSGFRSLGV